MVSINSRRNGRTVVQVFAKYPRLGKVKTRLAEDTSSEMAVQVHRELVERQLAQLMHLPGSVLIELWCTESADAEYYRMLLGRWPRIRYRRQSAGDLGQRLKTALQRAILQADRVLQIGTDCPVLQCEHVRYAAHLLGLDADTVFIPAEDGGYVLAGYTTFHPRIFDNIAWSTSAVLAQARRQLLRQGLNSVALPALWDIDHLQDLQRYRALQAVTAE